MKPILNKFHFQYFTWCFILGIGLLFYSCSNQPGKTNPSNEQDTTSNATQKIQTVGVVQPTPQSFTATVLITGTAMPNQKVKLFAMESGYVRNIRKDIGQRVQKGEIIATLENPMVNQLLSDAEAALKIGEADLMTAEAELQAAEAEAKAKNSIADRLKGIYKKTPQLTTLAEVERVVADALVANALISTKKSKVAAQKSRNEALLQQVNIAKERVAMLSIKAPFSGTITQRWVDAGALIQSGLTESNPQGIVEIQQTNPVRLTLPVPEADAMTIRPGMDVKVSFPELAGEAFNAKVSRTAGALDLSSKTMQIEIDLPNPNGKIITGMYAKAEMGLGSRKDVLSLPHTAQIQYNDAPHALIVNAGKVERISLRVGLAGKDYFEVLNADITAETQVIVQGKSLVKAGQDVKAIPAQ